jgi:hypothetical protein
MKKRAAALGACIQYYLIRQIICKGVYDMAAWQKTTHCGMGSHTRYREVDIYFYEQPLKGKRGRKGKESRPAQKRLNERNSVRHFHQLVKSNFFNDDYRIDLTYDDEHLPKSLKEGVNNTINFIKKLQRTRKKLGLEPLKYIIVDEGFDGTGRPHHHMIANGGIARELIESMWKKGKGKNAESLGMVRVEKLRFDKGGIEGLVLYITKQTRKDEERRAGATEGQMNLADVDGDISYDDLLGDTKGRRKWRASKNLIQPHERVRENAVSRKQVIRMINSPSDCEDTKVFFEKRNPGYILDTFTYVPNPLTGIGTIHATMHRKDWLKGGLTHGLEAGMLGNHNIPDSVRCDGAHKGRLKEEAWKRDT